MNAAPSPSSPAPTGASASALRRLAGSRWGSILLTSLIAAVAVSSWALADAFSSSIVLSLVSAGILLVASARQKATGRRSLLPQSRAEWVLAAAIGLLFLTAHGASLVAAANGRSDLCVAIAAVTFAVFVVGLWLDERLGSPTTP